ncbi:glycosyltransferase family 4 protein [Pseudobacteroides cellulosolvens]|uniref:Glycosyl transferase group 1 n=1 Tax=Pseudobacteroides cellulosolvens ATCC 35603 = DSM 2933 TaxID=398512 RepID=A0A0L6JUV4_9FIRM|nr:glycosyltransferase family 4 protein [Pseudobacteroides cellulosolvens]KNY29641.1 glycosyl transferase group 1 [Pseudobacteroides cellulosolvens ATCC 35603 = DSM 2933]
MDNKLKMLQICAVGFTVEKLLMPLIEEMSKNYDVTTVCTRDDISDKLKAKGYKIDNINIDRKISPVRNLRTVWQLYKYMKAGRFQIVHVHTPVAGILGRIAAKLARVPIIIYTAHGFYFHDNMSPIKKNIFIGVEKLGGWLSDYIFTQSSEDCKTAIEKKIIDKSKILTIGNGVDVERFDPARLKDSIAVENLKIELGIQKDDVVVTILGRVVREKGYMEWVRAAKEITEIYGNVKFLAIGSTLESDRDGIKADLDNFISENNLKGKVIFAGSRSDIPELLAITDIFTLPSYREGMPRSLIEAMCMCKPAVATDIRGCREEVDEGNTGFLVPVADYNALAEKIKFLIDNPDERTRMGVNARKKALEEFDEKKVLIRQREIIQKLVSEQKL